MSREAVLQSKRDYYYKNRGTILEKQADRRRKNKVWSTHIYSCPVCGKDKVIFNNTKKQIDQRRGCSQSCASKRSYAEGRKPKFGNRLVGKDCPWWKGGISKNPYGYILEMAKDHPNRNSGGYVLQHRLVMEKVLGRFLENFEEVHHKNGRREDNRPENLEVVFKKSHRGHVRCPHCLGEFAIH